MESEFLFSQAQLNQYKKVFEQHNYIFYNGNEEDESDPAKQMFHLCVCQDCNTVLVQMCAVLSLLHIRGQWAPVMYTQANGDSI